MYTCKYLQQKRGTFYFVSKVVKITMTFNNKLPHHVSDEVVAEIEDDNVSSTIGLRFLFSIYRILHFYYYVRFHIK